MSDTVWLYYRLQDDPEAGVYQVMCFASGPELSDPPLFVLRSLNGHLNIVMPFNAAHDGRMIQCSKPKKSPEPTPWDIKNACQVLLSMYRPRCLSRMIWNGLKERLGYVHAEQVYALEHQEKRYIEKERANASDS